MSISFIDRRNEFFPRIRLRDAREYLGSYWELCLVHSSRIQFSFAKSWSWRLLGLGSRVWLEVCWGESLGSVNCPNYFSRALCHLLIGWLVSWMYKQCVKWLLIFSSIVQSCTRLKEIHWAMLFQFRVGRQFSERPLRWAIDKQAASLGWWLVHL